MVVAVAAVVGVGVVVGGEVAVVGGSVVVVVEPMAQGQMRLGAGELGAILPGGRQLLRPVPPLAFITYPLILLITHFRTAAVNSARFPPCALYR